MQVSIVNYSEIENLSARLDSEYYKPDKLFLEQTLDSKPNSNLDSFGDFIIGPFGSSFKVENYDSESHYRYVRGKDVKPFFLLDNDNVHIPENDFNRLSKYSLEINDILISVVGTLGNASLITDKEIPSIFSCKSTVFRSSSINPYYLTAFLNSKYGYELLVRKARGAVQTGLNLDDLKYLSILKPSSNLEKQIGNILKNAFDKVETGKELYNDSESKILAELNISDWSPTHQLGFTKNFSDTQTSERFDAEYFQPKYDDLVNQIKNYSGGYDLFENLANVIDENFTPESNFSYKYIELSNIGNNGEITGFTEALGSELPTRARRKVSSYDIIVSSIEGSLESIALIEDSLDGALCSTGFYVINSDYYNSGTLLILLKSIVGQLQLKKGCSGTILTAINKGELSKIILPKIGQEIQEEIKSKISEMYESRGKSKALIEIAKRSVEMAIEQDETTAENWMNEEVVKLGVELNER